MRLLIIERVYVVPWFENGGGEDWRCIPLPPEPGADWFLFHTGSGKTGWRRIRCRSAP
jgi:hypothetical protein